MFVTDVEDPQPRRLTAWSLEASEPDWSPDGSQIAFSTSDEALGSAEIYVIAPDGSGLRPLTDEPGAAGAFRPSWSPDGERLVFTRVVVGDPNLDLFSIAADGTDVRQLTDTATQIENEADWG